MKNPLKHRSEPPPRPPPPLSPSLPAISSPAHVHPSGESPGSTRNLSSLFKGLSPHRRHRSSDSTAAHQEPLSPASPLSPSSPSSPTSFTIVHVPDRPPVPVRLSNIPSEDECRFLLRGLQDEADELPIEVSRRYSAKMDNKEKQKQPEKTPVLLRAYRRVVAAGPSTTAKPPTTPTATKRTSSPAVSTRAKNTSPPSQPARTANADRTPRPQKQTKALPDLPAARPRPSNPSSRSTPPQPRAAASQDRDKWNNPRVAPSRPGAGNVRSATKTSASVSASRPPPRPAAQPTPTPPTPTPHRVRPPAGPLASRAPIPSQHHQQQPSLASFSQRVTENGLRGPAKLMSVPVAVVPLSPPPRPTPPTRPAVPSPPTPASSRPSPTTASSPQRPPASSVTKPPQMAPAPLRARRPELFTPRISSPLRQSQTLEAPSPKRPNPAAPPPWLSKPPQSPRREAAVLPSSGTNTNVAEKAKPTETANDDAALAEALAAAWQSNGGEPLLEWDVEVIKASLEAGQRRRHSRVRTAPSPPTPQPQPQPKPSSFPSSQPSERKQENSVSVGPKQDVSANRTAPELSSTALAFLLKAVSSMPPTARRDPGALIASLMRQHRQPESRQERERREARRRERREKNELRRQIRLARMLARDDNDVLPAKRATRADEAVLARREEHKHGADAADEIILPDFAVYDDPDIDGADYAQSWPESRYYFDNDGYGYYDDDDDDGDDCGPPRPVSPLSPPLPALSPMPPPSPPPVLPPVIPYYTGPVNGPTRQPCVQQSALEQWRARRLSGL